MSTVERREVLIRRIEHVVPAREPWGADWTEVMKAVSAATAELRDQLRVPSHMDPPDDMIRMRVEDEAIVVYYEKSEVAR